MILRGRVCIALYFLWVESVMLHKTVEQNMKTSRIFGAIFVSHLYFGNLYANYDDIVEYFFCSTLPLTREEQILEEKEEKKHFIVSRSGINFFCMAFLVNVTNIQPCVDWFAASLLVAVCWQLASGGWTWTRRNWRKKQTMSYGCTQQSWNKYEIYKNKFKFQQDCIYHMFNPNAFCFRNKKNLPFDRCYMVLSC